MTAKTTKVSTIELNVREIAQLFETFDPYPFLQRDLDKDAEEFIVGWARELPRDHELKIVVHVPRSEAETSSGRELARSMAAYFAHRADAVRRDLRELFRIGRMSFAIGVGVLIGCVIAAQYVSAILGDGPFARVMEESLIILGWVANWRPLEIFLYEWWPIARRRNLYGRLAAAEITLNPL
ncbi:MAG: hypothetical protein JNL06_02320 [Alphaproteobacteria bacterium]|nr:hypothetical protein [Alphaproteobacteria bacterium]